MKKIVFLTPGDAEFGFRLAGVSQYVAGQGDEEKGLENSKSDEDAGLIIVDERTMKGISEEKMTETQRRWDGIIVVLPSPVKPASEVDDYAARLIRSAIGYHVRLKL